MPLQAGSNRKAISKNIAELIRSGRSKEEAAAAAFAMARKAKRKRGKSSHLAKTLRKL